MGQITLGYDRETCAICANYLGAFAVLRRERYHYFVDNNASGRCRVTNGTHKACAPVCSKFDPIPGFGVY